MSHLTQAQIAALQQMGICVWINADERVLTETTTKDSSGTAKTPSSASSKTASTGSINRVAQLRESLTGKTPAQSESVEPAVIPLTQKQRSQHTKFIDDVDQAWALCYPEKSSPQWVIGKVLRVTETTIELSCEPGQLTATQKAALWEKLWRQ